MLIIILVTLPGHKTSLRELKRGTQGRNLEQEPQRNAGF